MNKTLILAGLILAATPAGAYEYKAVAPTQCHPSFERFVSSELGGGAKLVEDNDNWHAGPFADVLAEWSNGVRERIAIAPTEAGVCIVARQFVDQIVSH